MEGQPVCPMRPRLPQVGPWHYASVKTWSNQLDSGYMGQQSSQNYTWETAAAAHRCCCHVHNDVITANPEDPGIPGESNK